MKLSLETGCFVALHTYVEPTYHRHDILHLYYVYATYLHIRDLPKRMYLYQPILSKCMYSHAGPLLYEFKCDQGPIDHHYFSHIIEYIKMI